MIIEEELKEKERGAMKYARSRREYRVFD